MNIENLKVGQKVTPIPLWNQTEQERNRLTVPTEILGVKKDVSQTGVMLQVKTKGGKVQWLDSGWFELNS